MLAQLGERVKQLRQEQQLTLTELARRTGLSVGLLSQLERGVGNPSFTTIAKLAGGLGIPLGYFLISRRRRTI